MSHLDVSDLRNIQRAEARFEPGLNVLVGRNAQGKTSLLEAVGLLARARSFRSEELKGVVRRGAEALRVCGTTVGERHETRLCVEAGAARKKLEVAGATVSPRDYHGRLEVQVYSGERLRVIHGSARERRQYFDRGAAAMWPAYRQQLRDYERVLAQRNAALANGRGALGAWDESFLEHGARLRLRRAHYLALLQEQLTCGYSPRGERYSVGPEPSCAGDDEGRARARLADEMRARQRDEWRAQRSLVGPHRDSIALRIDGHAAERVASAGQARSVLLALTLAALEIYRRERGTPAVALLDDLDSELDDERAAELCARVAGRGQALVTTAHAAWVRRVAAAGALFEVEAGSVRRAA